MTGLVGVVFWGGLWAIAIVAILLPMFREREMQKTLRHAIEKGQTLDPAIVEALMAPQRPKPKLPIAKQFLVASAVLIGLGLGSMVMSWFVSQIAAIAFYPIMGGGIVLGIMGAAFLLLSRLLDSRKGASPGDA